MFDKVVCEAYVNFATEYTEKQPENTNTEELLASYPAVFPCIPWLIFYNNALKQSASNA